MTANTTTDAVERAKEIYLEANRQANEFARTGLANLMILNGGAVIGFAPIVSVVGVNAKEHQAMFVATLVVFCLGLVAGMIAYLIGFFVNSELSAMAQFMMLGRPHDTIEESRLRHNKKRSWGILCAFLALGLFVVGGALVLMLMLS